MTKGNYRAARDPEHWKTPLDGLPRKLSSTGYISVRVMPGIWEGEHRMVMAQMLGRPLRADETAHHRNGNPTDNRPENLELWTKRHPSGQRASEIVRCPHCGKQLLLSADPEG